MARRIPNMYFFLRGTHVHHLNYGIFLLVAVGAYLLLAAPRGRKLSAAALAYGIALALTFDEFGMWLHLGGSYWQRASIDAIVIVAALAGPYRVRVRHPPLRVPPRQGIDRSSDRRRRIRCGAVRRVHEDRTGRGPEARGSRSRVVSVAAATDLPLTLATDEEVVGRGQPGQIGDSAPPLEDLTVRHRRLRAAPCGRDRA